jgi:hypothetical protein
MINYCIFKNYGIKKIEKEKLLLIKITIDKVKEKKTAIPNLSFSFLES